MNLAVGSNHPSWTGLWGWQSPLVVEPDGTKGASFCSEVNPNHHLKLLSTQVGLEAPEHGQGIWSPICPTQNCKANVTRPELICYYHLITRSPKRGCKRRFKTVMGSMEICPDFYRHGAMGNQTCSPLLLSWRPRRPD